MKIPGNLSKALDTLTALVPSSLRGRVSGLRCRANAYIINKGTGDRHGDDIRQRVRRQRQEGYRQQRILAIYDFTDLPFSFDIITFLTNAELQRRRKGCHKIDVAFVCHASDPGPPRHAYIDKNNFRHYLHNLGLEITRLFDSVGSVFVFDNRRLFMDFFAAFRRQYAVFPQDYKPSLPVEIRPDRPASHELINSSEAAAADPTLLCLHAPQEQVAVVRKWILAHVYPKVPVTITLREWDWWAHERNSNIPEWQKLVDYYQDSEVKFIVLRDYYKLYEAPVLSGPNIIYYNEPVVLLSLRAALYQECSLNLFVSVGCRELVEFNGLTRYLTFGLGAGGRANEPEDFLQHMGIQLGGNFPGATKYQKLVWEEDNFATMKYHLDRMLETLRADGVLTPSYYHSSARNKVIHG